MVVVQYERMIGRRVVGQAANGSFQTAASKTVPGTLDEWLQKWHDAFAASAGVDGVAFAGSPRVSDSEAWRYWRCGLDDGSKIVVTIGQKPGNKVTVAVQHAGLADAAAVARWKAVWRQLLDNLAAPAGS